MANGLLICSGTGKNKNIGDYIQSLAQKQFLNKIDCYVEREKLDEFVYEEKVNVIMNGWFMHHPTKFPPSEWINPLFVSFHVVPRNANRMLTPKVVEYLKQYQPIGTRDTGTCDLLKKHGVDCYFSGCLTLTLGLHYHSEEKSGKVYFVDPYYEFGNGEGHHFLSQLLSAFCNYMWHRKKINKLSKKFVCEFSSRLSRYSAKWEKRLMTASFYRYYSTLFSDDALFQAEYITHKVKQSLFKDDDEKLQYAEDLLKKYAKANYVVTSRIHCALPCVGIETPVLFVTSSKLEGDSLRSAGRFGGVIDFFHVLRWTSRGLVNCSSLPQSLTNKFSTDTLFANKIIYLKYKEELIKRVKIFLRDGK